MRIRFKKWARPELEASPFYIDEPEKYKEKWSSMYSTKAPFHIELGCGKGGFISQIASQNPSIHYLGIDLVDAMLGIAKRKIESVYQQENREINNVLLTRYDIERIQTILGKQDQVERIYINFCNPWPKPKHKKKRLTHPKQLESYQTFLLPGGEIHFKTDDDGLFQDSLNYFQQTGFVILKSTIDLHQDQWEGNVITEHEKMFSEQGIKIKALIAKYPN